MKKKRIFFLRVLFLKKYKSLMRKNLVPNFIFMGFLLNDFKLQKKNYLYKHFIKNNETSLLFLPDYLLRKRVMNDYVRFLKLKKKYKFNNYFFTDSSKNGFNVCLLNINDKSLFYKDLLNEENSYLISYKYQEILKPNYEFNYFFNFSIFLNSVLEFYKIIIFLNLNLTQNLK